MLALVLATQMLLAAETAPLAPDQAAHFAATLSLTPTGTPLPDMPAPPRWQAVAVSGASTFAIGLAKELVIDDEASTADLWADGLGVGLAAGMIFVFEF